MTPTNHIKTFIDVQSAAKEIYGHLNYGFVAHSDASSQTLYKITLRKDCCNFYNVKTLKGKYLIWEGKQTKDNQ